MCGMNVPCAASNSDHAHEHTVNMSRHKTNEYNAFLAPLSWWNLKQTNRIPIKILTVRYAVPFVPICCVRPQCGGSDKRGHVLPFANIQWKRRQRQPTRTTSTKNANARDEAKKQYANIPTDFITDKFNKVYFSFRANESAWARCCYAPHMEYLKKPFLSPSLSLSLFLDSFRAQNFHTLFS